jgi:hypothetical protein
MKYEDKNRNEKRKEFQIKIQTTEIEKRNNEINEIEISDIERNIEYKNEELKKIYNSFFIKLHILFYGLEKFSTKHILIKKFTKFKMKQQD